ncbi:uncharacterized protein LOC128239481 [Mya arenaria]|uniref:uncharacterized protein LOC128239481 n=1 Tax=Mya arenaria TaxID=6604 RepID=UPI0022E5F08C|nr:uncharacterized protein LOC128239481 [Mya arenaria]
MEARPARLFPMLESERETEENKNTKRKTETDMRIFTAFLVSLNETRPPHTIPPADLDRHLATYFAIIKKHDGNDYEAASLRGMLCSIERHLRTRNYPVSLTRDAEFANTRNMLKEKQKLLRELVKNDKVERQDSLASVAVQKLNQLYLAKEFGPHNATSVLNALCFSFVVHLKIKKAVDHKQLLWGDVVLLKSAATEQEYLCYQPLAGYEYCRLPLKGLSNLRVLPSARESSLWDPIAIYKLYQSKRPPSMMSQGSPFYLGVTSPQEEECAWYKPVAMGVNKLNDLVRMIRDITGTLPATAPAPTHNISAVHFGSLTGHANTDSGIHQAVLSTNRAASREQPLSLSDLRHNSVDDKVSLDSYAASVGSDLAVERDRKSSQTDTCIPETSNSNSVISGTSLTSPIYSNQDADSGSRALEEAKRRILDELHGLESGARDLIRPWLQRLYFDECTNIWKEAGTRTISLKVTLDIDSDCIRSQNPVSVPANVQIVSQNEERASVNCSDENLRSDSKASNEVEVISEESEAQQSVDCLTHVSNEGENSHTAPIKETKFSVKRAHSYPGSLHCEIPEKVYRPSVSDFENEDNAATASTPVSKADTADEANSEVHENSLPTSEKITDSSSDIANTFPLPNMNGHNLPFASWAYDPRFTMLLRNDFMQTYRGFIEAYNASKVKQGE